MHAAADPPNGNAAAARRRPTEEKRGVEAAHGFRDSCRREGRRRGPSSRTRNPCVRERETPDPPASSGLLVARKLSSRNRHLSQLLTRTLEPFATAEGGPRPVTSHTLGASVKRGSRVGARRFAAGEGPRAVETQRGRREILLSAGRHDAPTYAPARGLAASETRLGSKPREIPRGAAVARNVAEGRSAARNNAAAPSPDRPARVSPRPRHSAPVNSPRKVKRDHNSVYLRPDRCCF